MAYRMVYLRVRSSGYHFGWTSDADQSAFKDESRRIFQELGWELKPGSNGVCDTVTKTSMPGVYAAGDVVTGTKSVIAAIAAGRQAAEEVDRYLGGDGDISEQLADVTVPDPYIGLIEGFSKLPRIEPENVPVAQRVTGFAPMTPALSCKQASCEAARCLQCDLRLNLTRPKLWNEY